MYHFLYPQFFLELITTQLRFYMVSPQLSLLIILTMQSYKFYHFLFSFFSFFLFCLLITKKEIGRPKGR